MNRVITVTAVASAFFCVSPAMASGAGERITHYKVEPAKTLPEAVQRFSEYNAKLDALLKGEVSDGTIAEVHQLTYTLEDALGRINKELDELAETLEKLHVASEKADRAEVVRHGEEYLSVSRQIVK